MTGFKGIAAGCICGLALGCGIQGNGDLTAEDRTVTGFVRLENATSVPAVVQEGSPFLVTLTVDSNLQSHVTTVLVGDSLVIDENTPINVSPQSIINIQLPDFRGAELAGSGTLSVTGVQDAKDLTLEDSGSGDLSYTGPADKLDVSLSGSGQVHLGGTAEVLDAVLSGSGSIRGKPMSAHSASLTLSGSGSIEATLNGGEVDFLLSGSGSIDWYGPATVTSSTVSGSGSVTHH